MHYIRKELSFSALEIFVDVSGAMALSMMAPHVRLAGVVAYGRLSVFWSLPSGWTRCWDPSRVGVKVSRLSDTAGNSTLLLLGF